MSGGLGEWIVLGSLILTAGGRHAQTQADINQDACAQYQKADQLLNQTYSQVLKDYAKDPEFLAKFKQAQRAWIAFRDAYLAARFPKTNKQVEYGSSYHLPLHDTHRTHPTKNEGTEDVGGWHSRG